MAGKQARGSVLDRLYMEGMVQGRGGTKTATLPSDKAKQALEELGEDVELLAQEVVREVHRRVEHAEAVLLQGRGDGPDVDRADVLRAAVRAPLDEVLLVEVVGEAAHEDVDVLHDAQHVETHVERPHGQVVVAERDAVRLEAELLLLQPQS